MRTRRRLLVLGLVVLASAGLAFLLGDTLGGLTGVRSFEDFTFDLRQQTTPTTFQGGPGGEESEIVLVLFDELTVEEMPWISPFPRAHLADLVDAASRGGARTIGVDVYLDLLFPRLDAINQGNQRLRDVIRRAGNVILASPLAETDGGYVAVPPNPYFAEVAVDVGTSELPSSFETFRDGTLAVRSGPGLEPSFVLALYAHARDLDADSLLDAAWSQGRVALPGLPEGVGTVPAAWRQAPEAPDEDAIIPFRILYHGPPSGTMSTDPPGTFIARGSLNVPTLVDLDPDLFRDKIVIIGSGFHPEDRFRTPFYGYSAPDADGGAHTYDWMYGVEIHANALQNILRGTYVRPMGPTSKALLVLILASLVAGVVFFKGTGWGAVATVGAVFATWALAFWAWAGVVYGPGGELFEIGSVGAWMPIGTPVLGTLVSYVAAVAYVAIVEGREKRFIKRAFGKYLSPDVVAEISEDPSALTLGGEKRRLTLLFSDLSGFTSIAEDMEAEELISILNDYLNDMTEVVFDEKGYLDKYIGDAIMAFWNAPRDVPDHADRAMHAAVRMQRRMSALNERRTTGEAPLQALVVRIGVHTGEVVVGNFGGEERFDYSAIGDDVNLAARLEPANKDYDTLIMVSEDTLRAATQRYHVRELDIIAVKGKDDPVAVYELLELGTVSLDPGMEEVLGHYREGMRAYRRRRWSEARTRFQAALAARPHDGPSRVYHRRCLEHMLDPPPHDWDFVVRRTEK